MAHPSSPGGRARERLVLAVGLVSTLALLWAAFAAYGEPRRVGESELARRMGEFADAVVAEWNRLRRDPWPFAEGGEPLRWSDAFPPPDDAPAPRDWLAERAGSFLAFDALMAEARRVEREEDDTPEALAIVLETLTKPCDPPRRAEGRLRAIQLALRTEQVDVAHAQWQAAAEELEGWEARGDTSYLLLCTLAAAPHLTADERRDARTRLVELWQGGHLA
ncbi:MAG: hypothetical protein GY711_06430, partial [bacterium]|nr:hypothetical protein [bacterium]